MTAAPLEASYRKPTFRALPTTAFLGRNRFTLTDGELGFRSRFVALNTLGRG